MKRLYDKAMVDEIAKNYGNDAVFLSEFSRALLDIIREGLIRDGQVRLHQFGTFKLKWMKSRNGVNPSTGEKMLIQGRPRVIFSPAKGLKDIIEPNPPTLQPLEDTATETVTPAIAPAVAAAESVVEDTPDTTLVIKLKTEDHPGEENELVEPIADKEPNSASLIEDDNRAIADIQDEIEVLEQVVDILSTDARNDAAEEDNLEDSHKDQVASDWLDSPVVEKIKEISELQYFKSESASATSSEDLAASSQAQMHKSEPQTSAIASVDDIEQVLVADSSEDKLDFDLSDDAVDSRKKESSNRPWFAIAAAVVVLLATGLLFNALWTPSTTSPELASTDASSSYLYSYYPADNETKQMVVDENIVPVAENNQVDTSTTLETTVAESEPKSDQWLAEQAQPTKVVSQEEHIKDDVLEGDQIIVSSEQYNEVKRASAEQSVYFLERDHRLVNGDSLWRLAKKHYVNPFYWPHIYQANHKKINNPDRVKIGRLISLPTLYGEPEDLTKRDKRNIAMGYYFNYLYHKQKGNPFAYFSLIGVDKFDADLLIEFQEEISRSDVSNLALLSE